MDRLIESISAYMQSNEINETTSLILISLFTILIWLIIGIVLNLIFKKALIRLIKRKSDNPRTVTIGKLLTSIVRYVVWFVIVVVIFGELGIDVTPFIASAGVIGLAVGFGAQEIVKDFISGFFILFEDNFHVGEIIEVDGFKGQVMSLGLRTTTITNWKGEVKVINNGDIRGMVNFSRNNSIAIIEFGVDYDTNLSVFNDLMKVFVDEMFEKYDDVLEVPTFLGVSKLSDSSIDMTLIAKTKPMQHFAVERSLRKEIVEYCKENKVNIPYPHMVIKND